jgi:acetyl-CoA acetyltransferase
MSEATDLLGERRALISGAGQSDVGRRLHRDPLELTLDACLAAIEDAGLTTADIDGISTYPGGMASPAGFTGAGVTDVHDALRLNLNWWTGALELPSQLGSVINACLAVSAGLATHVLCFRSVFEGSAQGEGGRAAVMPGGGAGGSSYRADGFMEWLLPYSAPSAR